MNYIKIMNWKKFSFVFCFILGLLLILFPHKISAQNNGDTSVSISPIIFDKTVNPGDVLNLELKVKNNSPEAKTMFAFIKDFKAEGEEGRAQLINPGGENSSSLSSWITINKEGELFEKDQEKIIPFTIKVPENTGPGGYYGAISYGTKPPETKGEGVSMAFGQQITSLILVQIRGKSDEKAILREFTTDKKFYSTPFDVLFTTKIENQGNVHIKPVGVIEITDMGGKKKAILPFNEKRGNILPKSTRVFHNNWDDTFGFGRYRAHLLVNYGSKAEDGGLGIQNINYTLQFWILPWKIITPIASGLVILIIIIIILANISKNRAIKKTLKNIGMSNEEFKHSQKQATLLRRSSNLRIILIILIMFIVTLLLLGILYIFIS